MNFVPGAGESSAQHETDYPAQETAIRPSDATAGVAAGTSNEVLVEKLDALFEQILYLQSFLLAAKLSLAALPGGIISDQRPGS